MSERDGSTTGEEAIDARRYLAALRRSRWLIVLVVSLITVVVLALSLTLEDSYEATATLVYNPPSVSLLPGDAEPERRIATFAELITSTPVLSRAAESLDLRTLEEIEDDVSTEISEISDLIDITARDPIPLVAADLANSVSEAFLELQAEIELREIVTRIDELRSQRDRFQEGSQQFQLRQQQIDELQRLRGGVGFGLRIADPADVPGSPASPKPIRNTILALFFGLFIGVLVALARDYLRPGVSNPRELSRLSRLDVLAGIPYINPKRGRRRHHDVAMEHEAYQSLGAAVQLALPASEQHVILVTSALHGEGKSTATARLGQVLAETGHSTLLISGDLRWPALHEAFDLEVEPGLTDALELIQRSGLSRHILPATVKSVPLTRDSSGKERSLDVLPSGRKVRDPATLLSGEALGDLLDHVRSFDYRYVLIDGPPMLGIADGQAIAQRVDRMIIVSRLESLTVETVVDMRELLDRLGAAPLGLVAIGAQVEVSPYYQSERAREESAANRGGTWGGDGPDPGDGVGRSAPQAYPGSAGEGF